MAQEIEDLFAHAEGELDAGAHPPLLSAIDRSFACPRCQTLYNEVPNGVVKCAHCRWTGAVQYFDPLPVDVKEADAALPDNAACAHHPTKLATAVCAGTGDFICELCRVELQGEPYSVQFLESGGKEKLEMAYRRTMPRPDRAATNYLLLCIIPYVNLLAILWIPLGAIQYFRVFPLRKKDPLFRRLVSIRRMVVVGVGLMFFLAMWVIVAFALTWVAFESSRLREEEASTDFQQEVWQEEEPPWPIQE